jgi:TctA family transporter
MMSATSPRLGGAGDGLSVNAAESSANNHGRPRQPRPMTTPSQPVTAIMVSASLASKMSPLPSTGIVRTCCLSWAICSQSAVPE